MNINVTGFVQVPEKFEHISAVLWDNDIQHQTYCVEQDGQQSHIEVEFDLESARVLHDFGWISTDEWEQLIDAKTDYITIY
jgi:hypothetical protein